MLKTIKLRHTLLHLQFHLLTTCSVCFPKKKACAVGFVKVMPLAGLSIGINTRYAPAMAVVKPSVSANQAVPKRAFSI